MKVGTWGWITKKLEDAVAEVMTEDAANVRPCGHTHVDAEWRALEAAYARRAWRAQLIRALLTGEPQTFEVLDLQDVLNAFFFRKMAEPERSRLIAGYLQCIQAWLMLDPCAANRTEFPRPTP